MFVHIYRKMLANRKISIVGARAIALLMLAPVPTAFALTVDGNTRDCSKPVTYTEANHDARKMHFTVDITDHNGALIKNIDLGDIPGHGSVTIPINPKDLPRTDTNCDATNHSWIVAAGGGVGARADLSLEVVLFDPVTHIYSIGSNAGIILDNPSLHGLLSVPDLWADTTGDGSLDTGDFLYSLIDFAQMPAPFAFSPLQNFDIVNGTVAELPGMRFSTTPFVFDPLTGFDTGTPYSGTGIVLTQHDVTVPEPMTLALLGLGMTGLAFVRRRRNAAC